MYAKGNFNALTDAATIAVDFNVSNNHKVTLGAAGRTVTFSNGVAGEFYTLQIAQDATGSRTITTWPTSVVWAGGSAPTLTTTASYIDEITFLYDGSKYRDVSIKLNFAS